MIETVPSGTILQGHYRIERVLGSGGFGHVYLAIDLETNQQYAVKEYLVSGTSGQEQLNHEATVLSQLHHPNLPAFLDAFHERGRYYVVLNYIEGNDLTDLVRIARQRNDIIPLPRIMEWLLSICNAVLFLHSQHPPVIHRDIKPDNIRITPNGTAILVDLGNAKSAADGARTLFFIRHQGTPGYAPQEQYPGGGGTDERSDVYALGGTLYFALTAHEPPSVSTRNQSIQQGQVDLPSLQEQLAKNPLEDSPEANAARQFRLGISKPAKPAPRHSKHLAQLGTLPPEVLARLNILIQRAMAMKPKDRYPSVAEFAHDLKRVLDALPAAPAQVATSHPLDPHSTQPDLPMLYDSMQAAKDAGDQDVVAQAATPGASSSVLQYCPRCNTPLVPKAAFCPRCGTSLTNLAPNTLQDVQTSNTTIANTAPPQKTPIPKRNKPGAADISTEQTVQVSPQTRAAQRNQQNVRTVNGTQDAASAQNARSVMAQAIPASSSSYASASSKQPQQARRQSSTKSTTGNSRISPMMVIFMIALVIVLLIIMVVLIVTRTHHHAALPLPLDAFVVELQVRFII